MEQTLLLNASYEPLKIVHWQKAVTLWCQGKVEVISVYDRDIRGVSITFKLPSVIRLLRYIKIKRRFDYVPFSRANIYARDDHRCQYCGENFPTNELTFDHVVPVAQGGRKDWENIVSSCVTCNRRKGGRTPAEAGMHLMRTPRRPESAPAIRITVGLRNAPESWRDYLYWNAELDDTEMPARVAAIRPLWAIEGGRITLEGTAFPIEGPELPDVRVGDRQARIVLASPSKIAVLVPAGIADGARVPVKIEGIPGETAFITVAVPFATGLHQVDNPVFDDSGNLYVTFSGTRGQQVPVSIFRVRPNGTRETFSSGVVNPTSTAIDPAGRLYVSSRFEGTVYRLADDGTAEAFAHDLGVPCGLAFDADGTLYVGDRSGTIFAIAPNGRARVFASLPPSVAAFHLAMGPDRALYVTAPTLSPYDAVYRIDRDGTVNAAYTGFGRPQGIAFDSTGTLFVIEALAGSSGLYRVGKSGPPELMLAAPGLVGLAFDPGGGVVVCSNETAYRLASAHRPLR